MPHRKWRASRLLRLQQWQGEGADGVEADAVDGDVADMSKPLDRLVRIKTKAAKLRRTPARCIKGIRRRPFTVQTLLIALGVTLSISPWIKNNESANLTIRISMS